ncbi:four helix bundle protein [Bizionia argentinensis JUB59]|uniref:Four helix bundle protein n=1 Tax=Bizionia argentinensis JUB59 TaxID=1046627 RepID=G2EA63_9FLAO|nr:four helix bundle protein [Bizionia argentinensis]EGV44701.1 four helix bundle protein [Bizionia argentinensis JUB59]
MKPIQLEDRLIQFVIDVILVSRKIDESFASEHLAKQLIRSSTSAALNYGEARSGESTRDFLHKMKICLKELRECYINMKIQKGANLITDIEALDKLLKENDELISIFVVSIKTASLKLK